MARVMGRMRNPDSVTLAPKPKPAAAGICASCGRKANTPNIEAPNNREARLLVQIEVSRISFMSISGLAEPDSTATQAANSAMAARLRPITLGEVQPHCVPKLSGSSSATSQPASRLAAIQLMVPPLRTSDSGTTRRVAAAPPRKTSMGIQNRARQPKSASIGPARTVPRPLPMAMIADTAPIMPGSLVAGNSSRIMP